MRRRLWTSIVGAVAAVPLITAADNLLKNGDAEADAANWNAKEVSIVSESPHSGKSCFLTASTIAQSTEMIEIDPSKTYKLTGWLKSADDKPTNVYLALVPFDKDKVQIQSQFANPVKGTETTLAEGCKPEDKIIKVVDGSKWTTQQYGGVAFNADDSGEFKDLPNKETVLCGIKEAQKKGASWEVTLEKPCGKSFPAGTKVREHTAGASFIYPWVSVKFQCKEWKEGKGTIKGTAQTGLPGQQFWSGTKYVKVAILSLEGGKVAFDDIVFEEVKEAK